MTVEENGNKEWRNSDGNLHRVDGPAIERADGPEEWWLDGEQVTKEEVKRAATLKRVATYRPNAQQVEF